MSHAQLTWHGPLCDTRIHAAQQQGLHMAATHLLNESRKQAPHDEGILEASAHIQALPGGGRAVAYDTPYARRQHEELAYRHLKRGKAKYLEDPGNSEKPTMIRIFTTHLKKATQ